GLLTSLIHSFDLTLESELIADKAIKTNKSEKKLNLILNNLTSEEELCLEKKTYFYCVLGMKGSREDLDSKISYLKEELDKLNKSQEAQVINIPLMDITVNAEIYSFVVPVLMLILF